MLAAVCRWRFANHAAPLLAETPARAGPYFNSDAARDSAFVLFAGRSRALPGNPWIFYGGAFHSGSWPAIQCIVPLAKTHLDRLGEDAHSAIGWRQHAGAIAVPPCQEGHPGNATRPIRPSTIGPWLTSTHRGGPLGPGHSIRIEREIGSPPTGWPRARRPAVFSIGPARRFTPVRVCAGRGRGAGVTTLSALIRATSVRHADGPPPSVHGSILEARLQDGDSQAASFSHDRQQRNLTMFVGSIPVIGDIFRRRLQGKSAQPDRSCGRNLAARKRTQSRMHDKKNGA